MHYIEKTSIQKGWSTDRKYCVVDATNTKYLLRISDVDQFEKKRLEYEFMKKVHALSVPICRPIEFGTSSEGVYSVHSWIDGQDATAVILTTSDKEQYRYGVDAGMHLRTIHSIPCSQTQENWETYFNRKMDQKIQQYLNCPIQYANGHLFIDYIHKQRHLLKNRPQSYQHGDYHIGNMIIGDNQELYIIDFDRMDIGDPWEEFNRIVWSAQQSPLFASGLINGYFKDEVPEAFWPLLALYIASNTLGAIAWAVPFGQEQINIMLQQAEMILDWFDHLNEYVPKWYVSNKEL